MLLQGYPFVDLAGQLVLIVVSLFLMEVLAVVVAVAAAMENAGLFFLYRGPCCCCWLTHQCLLSIKNPAAVVVVFVGGRVKESGYLVLLMFVSL